MRATLGAPPDFELDHPVAEEPLRQVEEMLTSMQTRTDTARNALDFAAAVPAMDPGDFFRVADMRALPDFDEGGERRLKRMLDGRGCDAAQIRRRLVAGAAPEAVAMVIEFGEIVPVEGRVGHDLTALSLLGDDYVVPVGLRRTGYPPEEVSAERLEQRNVHDLVSGLEEDLALLGMQAPPLVSFDQRLASNHPLRRHLRELGIEFVLPIDECFDEAIEPRRPGERLRGRRLLSERMRFALDGTPPEPEVYSMAAAPEHREYFFGLPGGEAEYALVYPGIFSPGGLTGRRGLDRGGELVRLARQLHPPRVIERMHLLRFLHSSPDGWEKAAYLLAALWAAHFGRLPASVDDGGHAPQD